MTDQDHARAIHHAALALNAAITAATKTGLRVDAEIDEVQAFTEDWPRPAVRVAVMRPINPEEG